MLKIKAILFNLITTDRIDSTTRIRPGNKTFTKITCYQEQGENNMSCMINLI